MTGDINRYGKNVIKGDIQLDRGCQLSHIKSYLYHTEVQMKKYYFLYKTTNLINQHYYIGVHSTNNLEDGYFGSGLKLQNAIKKYGIENFVLETLEFFDNEKDMYAREAEIVNEEFIKQPDVYNIVCGGLGGFISKDVYKKISQKLKGRKVSEKTRKKISEANKGKPGWNKGKTDCHSEETRKKISENKKGKPTWSKGKKFSDEYKQKISKAKQNMSEETKQKLREAWIRRKADTNYIPSMKGKKHTQETKDKIRDKLLTKKS